MHCSLVIHSPPVHLVTHMKVKGQYIITDFPFSVFPESWNQLAHCQQLHQVHSWHLFATTSTRKNLETGSFRTWICSHHYIQQSKEININLCLTIESSIHIKELLKLYMLSVCLTKCHYMNTYLLLT